jgi:hypothetical protein
MNQCHPGQRGGFAQAHSFARDACTICHGGDRTGTTKDESHAGMTGFPGNLENAATACGVCHAEQVASVRDSLMHTGRGIVQTIRKIVDGTAGGATNANFQSLGHGAADSMLRRLCGSGHLGSGTLEYRDNDVHFEPGYPLLQDGLPADAWTSVDGKTGGQAPRAGQRPLNREEMEAVLAAPIP